MNWRRLLAPCAAVFLSSFVVPLRGAPLLLQETPALQEGTSSRELLGTFVSKLESLRSGESGAPQELAAELSALGREACERFERCDVLNLAEFYSGLTKEQRVAGYLLEQEFNACWTRVREAGNAGLDAEAWSEARTLLVTELEDLARRAGELADPAPAARAWSLTARLGLAELNGGELEPEAAHDLALECREYAERAAELFAHGGYVTPQLEPLWLLARLTKLEGRAEVARRAFHEVLELAQSVGNVDFQLHALSGLSDLARARGDAHGVDLCLIQMAALRRPSGEGAGFKLVLRHAMRLIHQDEARAALHFLGRHQPSDLPANSANLSAWYLARASAHTRLNELDVALESWNAAEEIEQARGARAAESWNLELIRARIEMAAGRYGPALRILERCAAAEGLTDERTSDESASPPAELQLEFHAMRGEALLHLARHDAARLDLERALQLAQQIDASLEPDQDWSDEAANVGAFSARANVLGEALGVHRLVLLAEANILLGDALRAAREIENSQSNGLRRSARRGEEEEPVDVVSWAESMELGLVTWAVGPDETVVCELSTAGRRGGIQASGRVIPLGRSAVTRAVRRLREAILAGEEERARRLGAELSHALFPLDQAEPSRRGRRLYALHGPLEELPLEWLLAEGLITGASREKGAGDEPLPTRIIPLVLPGLPAIRPGSPSSSPLRWTLLGDPRGSEGEVLLPGAHDELDDLIALHPGALELRGSAFTKEAALAVLQLAPLGTGALHIATHLTRPGEFGSAAPAIDRSPASEAGLLCATGAMLTPAELHRVAPHFRLAVLSACTTGGGRFVDGEGLEGVARALLAGGTRNVVVTLWPVEDRAAQRFSIALHRSLSAGRAPSVAAHEARTELREAGLPAADWAAFRLLGRD